MLVEVVLLKHQIAFSIFIKMLTLFKVGDFLNICNSEKVASTITSLAAAKLSYKPLQRTTASTSSISDLDETFHQDDDFNKSELALVSRHF